MGQAARPWEAGGRIDYIAIENSPRFTRLRSTHRRFVIPAVLAGLAWYVAYVLLASWATDFMSTKVFGNVNWAVILGLAQIASTFVATLVYVSFANRKLDPQAAAIREEIETELGAAP